MVIPSRMAGVESTKKSNQHEYDLIKWLFPLASSQDTAGLTLRDYTPYLGHRSSHQPRNDIIGALIPRATLSRNRGGGFFT